MPVISITIENSADQLIAGIPRTVLLETNIPATIFYTLDGTTPTNASNVFISAIVMPTDQGTVVLQAFATNGIDTSPIVSQTYSTNIINDTRLPHSPLPNLDNNILVSNYPFGSNTIVPESPFLNPAQAGTTVNNPSLPIIPYGFDANGNPIGANQALDSYQNIYSTTDSEGRSLPGVGNLPAKTTIIGKRQASEYAPESSSRSSKLFDPRAMVIFQDSTTEDPSNPPMLNRNYFSMENEEIVKDGAVLGAAVDLETQTTTGSFIRSFYNPRTQMMTYYYRDSATNRWIISSQPYDPKTNKAADLSGMVFPKEDSGAGFVFRWFPFQRRVLF